MQVVGIIGRVGNDLLCRNIAHQIAGRCHVITCPGPSTKRTGSFNASTTAWILAPSLHRSPPRCAAPALPCASCVLRVIMRSAVTRWPLPRHTEQQLDHLCCRTSARKQKSRRFSPRLYFPLSRINLRCKGRSDCHETSFSSSRDRSECWIGTYAQRVAGSSFSSFCRHVRSRKKSRPFF